MGTEEAVNGMSVFELLGFIGKVLRQDRSASSKYQCQRMTETPTPTIRCQLVTT